MHTYWEVILEALIDTVKILPLLFVVYYLIELIEFKYAIKIQNNKKLKGKTSPLYGSLLGCIPQCGFSVVSTDLYSKGAISIGALIAVFIATSDEALPIMISDYKSIPALLCLLLTKIVFGVIVGYITMLLYSKIFSGKNHEHHEEHHDHDEDEKHHEEHLHACCQHDLKENKFNWKHPLLHCIKITLYIFIINLIMGTIIHFVGEETLSSVLKSSSIFQPVLALAIGLIPNCASSVVLTELYLMGGLSFGSIVAGLSVNAGLGFLVLLKQNKNIKENLFVLCMLLIPSLLVGYALHFIPFNLI